MPSRVAEILIAQANAAADAARQRGAIWGNAFGNIGQSIAQLPGEIQHQKQQDALTLLAQAREAREAGDHARATALFHQSQAVEAARRQIVAKAIKPDGTWDTSAATAAGQEIGMPDVALDLNEKYNPSPAFHPAGSQGVNPKTGLPIPGATIPEKVTYEAPVLRMVNGKQQLVRTATQGDQTWTVDLQGKKIEGDIQDYQAQPASESRMMRIPGIGDVPVDYIPSKTGGAGKVMYLGQDVSATARQIPPATIQIQNQLTKDLGASTAIDASRPDPATGNTPDPKTGLTPNAIFQGATAYALEGKLPPMGLGSSPRAVLSRTAIQNKAGALAAAAGVDLPQLQAEYKANSAALTKLLPQAKATATAANAARDNLDLALAQSDQVTRTGARLANRYVQWAQGQLTPAAGLTKFEVYTYTAAREYAKVASGGALSAQGLTDSAAREAEKLLSATQSKEGFAAAAEAMKADMANVITEQGKTLAGISQTIGNFFSLTNGGQPVESGTTKSETSSQTYKVGGFTIKVKQ